MTRKPKNKFYRPRATKEPRSSILIVCEGNKLEPEYFRYLKKQLRLGGIVDIHGSKHHSAPISVVERALKLRETREKSLSSIAYDEVWCVIDVDCHESLDRACDKAKKKDLRLAISNPCFEYWLLLHFEKTSSQMDTAKTKNKLEKHFSEFPTAGDSFFKEIYPQTESAIKHANEVLRERGYTEDLRQANSATHVQKIVSELQEMKH